MRKRKNTIWLLIAFIVGLSVLAYPHISNIYNKHRADKLITEYTQSESKISEEEYLDEKLSVQKYNEELLGHRVPDVFKIYENKPDETYESLMNLNGDSIMGYIEIPKIDVNIPIYHYTTDEVLEKGAGHLVGSSLPFGGDSTHAVITAHRGLPTAKMFTDLDLLEDGDLFLIHVFSDTLAYEIDQIETVLPSETRSLSIEPGKNLVTLMTCTPYAKNTHRLLVRGHNIPYTNAVADLKDNIKPVVNTGQIFMHIKSVIAGVLTACVILLLLSLGKRIVAKRKRSRMIPYYAASSANNVMRNQIEYPRRVIPRKNVPLRQGDVHYRQNYPASNQQRKYRKPSVQIKRVDTKGHIVHNRRPKSNGLQDPRQRWNRPGEDERR